MPRFHNRPLLAVILLAWMCLIVFATLMLMRSELSRWESDFESDVSLLSGEIKNRLDTNEAVLAGFCAFLQAVDRGDSDSALRYAAATTTSYPQIYMIEVARKVPASEQAHFEASLRKLWRPDFSIKRFSDLTKRADTTPAQSNDIWPILFMYPSLPEAQAIYGMRLETVDSFSYSLAVAQNSPKAVVSPVFDLYEGGAAYILLKEVSRASTPAGTSLNLFGDTMAALLLIKTQALLPAQIKQEEHASLYLLATMISPKGTASTLFEHLPETGEKIDALFLPRFKRTLTINNAAQPVVLQFKRQLLWSEVLTNDLKGMLALLLFVLFFVPWLMLRHNRNIAIAEAAHEKSAYLATHDLLTDLPNRFLFVDRFKQAVLNSERNGNAFAVLLLDLDHFKHVNDSHGHEVGDQVLIEAARRMVHELRSIDTVGRLGGDEFIILLTDLLDENDARTVGEKLGLAITQPMATTAGPIHISCSIGIALYPRHGKTLDMLKQSADKAMYVSKHNGRNSVSVSPG